MSNLQKDRLNSNIYKNIFPEEVLDINFIETLKANTIHSSQEIKQKNHEFSVGDVLMKVNNQYVRAVANDSLKTNRICGIVSAIRSTDIFTLIDSGQIPYPHQFFNDTTVLYLSDKVPGQLCHYKDIDNMTYIPIAIYTDNSIIINILEGTNGAPLAPYDTLPEEAQKFERYSIADLNDIINSAWRIS